MNGPRNVSALRTIVRTAIVIAGLASLGACASIPQRAWANGRSLESSRAYQSVLGGNMSIQAHKQMFWDLNQRSYYQTAYQPFGDWWN